MPNCRPWYLSCWETSWWMDYVCSVFMNLSGDPDNLRLVGFTIPYGTHRAQWAAKGYPQQCPAQNRMRDQRPPLNVIDSAKLTFDKWKMCISNQRAGSWTTQVRTVVHFCFDIQKNFYTRSDLLLTSSGIRMVCHWECLTNRGITAFNKNLVLTHWRSEGRSQVWIPN